MNEKHQIGSYLQYRIAEDTVGGLGECYAAEAPPTGKSDSVRSCVRAGEAKLCEGVSEGCSSTLGLWTGTFPPFLLLLRLWFVVFYDGFGAFCRKLHVIYEVLVENRSFVRENTWVAIAGGRFAR